MADLDMVKEDKAQDGAAAVDAGQQTGAVQSGDTSVDSAQSGDASVSAAAGQDNAPHSSMAGLGVDIVEIERMSQILERTPSFKTRVFSEGEQKYCDAKHKPAVHYAMRFAAKEAVLKALGTGIAQGIALQEIEVVHNSKGRPEPKLYGRVAQIAKQQGVIEVHLSLSRTHDTAVANAVAVTQDTTVVPKEDKLSPKEEIAAAFKELRNMLDEMDIAVDDDDAADNPDNTEASDSAKASDANNNEAGSDNAATASDLDEKANIETAAASNNEASDANNIEASDASNNKTNDTKTTGRD